MNAPTSILSNKEHNSSMEKVVKSKIELGLLPFMISNLVHKFQMICLNGT